MQSEPLSRSRQDSGHCASRQQKVSADRKIIDEVQQLSKNIRAACEKNRLHYNKILKLNPYFGHTLYNPPILLNTKKSEINLTRNLLMRQLDNLLQEENKFMRELAKLKFKQEEQKFSKECHLQKAMSHYAFLQSVWKRNIIATDSEDRIEKLNKSVALIKGQIMTINKRQQADAVSNESPILIQYVLNSPQYIELKGKYQRLLLEKEHTDILPTTEIKLISSPSNRSEQKGALENQNQNLRNQIQQYRQKIRNLEKVELTNKIRMQQLEEQIYNKQRQLHKLNKEIKLIYKNEDEQYQIQILSKALSGRQQKKLFVTLETVIQNLHSLEKNFIPGLQLDLKVPTKNYGDTVYSARDSRPSANHPSQESPTTKNSNTYEHQNSERKRFSHIHLDMANPHHARRLKSISETNVQQEMKKARFIRTSTRNNLDDGKEKSGKDESEETNDYQLPSRPPKPEKNSGNVKA